DIALRATVHEGRRQRERARGGGRQYPSQRTRRDRTRALRHHPDHQLALASVDLVDGQSGTAALVPADAEEGRVMRDIWRRALSHALLIFCGASVVLALVPLAFILFYVVTQGITALNLDFFRHTPAPVGEIGGGMANAIVGSLIVTGLGALFAIPVGVLSGLYAAEYRGTRFASATRLAAALLHGAPSIRV